MKLAFESSSDEEDGKKLEELEQNHDNSKLINQDILKENNFQDGEVPHRDMSTDSNKSLNETAGFSSSTNTIKKMPKVKILKRGETFASLANDRKTFDSSSNMSSSKDLLQMLRNPISSTVSSNQQSPKSQHPNGEDEIMMMLKRNSVSKAENIEETASTSSNKNDGNASELLGILRPKGKDVTSSEHPGIKDVSIEENNPAKGLLSILKNKDFERKPHTEDKQSNEFQALKHEVVTENEKFNNTPPELLNFFNPNSPNSGYGKISSEDNSYKLPNILHDNKSSSTFNNSVYATPTEIPTATTGGYPMMPISNENSSNKLLSMLQNRPGTIHESNFDVRSNGTSGSNELLNILHRK